MKKSLGEIIKELRNKKEISQRELARRIDVDNATISKIESGKIEKPSYEMITKISKELNASISQLLKTANYETIDEIIYYSQIEELYENPILYKLDNKIIDKVITIRENYIYLDMAKILNEYKKGNLDIEKTARLLYLCKPIDLDDKIIYINENKDIIINLE